MPNMEELLHQISVETRRPNKKTDDIENRLGLRLW